MVVVVCDGCLFGLELVGVLVDGLCVVGVDVVDVGMVLMLVGYFVVNVLFVLKGGECCVDLCIVVMGSYNLFDYNGFKMVLCGVVIYGE